MPSSRHGTGVAARFGGSKYMCLVVFAYDCHPDYRLIFGANRDEFRNRPAEPARYWNGAPHVLAGRGGHSIPETLKRASGGQGKA